MFAVFVLGLVMILLLIGVALYVGGVFSPSSTPTAAQLARTETTSAPSSSAQRSGTTPTYTATTGATQLMPTGATEAYTGQVFSIAYPSGWEIASSEKQYSWGTDTTIKAPQEPMTLIRVERVRTR